jgi:predicted PurR-regulated permease PerM
LKFGQWIGLILLVLSLYQLWQVRQLVLILFMAIVLANGLELLVKRFQQLGLRRSYAVLLALGSLLLGMAIFTWAIIPPAIAQFRELGQLVPRGIEQLLVWVDRVTQSLDSRLLANLPSPRELIAQFQPIIEKALGGGFTIFYGSLGSLLSLLLLLALTVMLLADPLPYRQGFIRLFPAFYRPRINEVLYANEIALQRWLSGIALNMAIVGVVTWVGLLIFQIPLALSQGVLTGLLSFIPNFGLVLSAIPPIAIALLQAPWKGWLIVILFVGIQQLESHFLTPRLMRQQMSFLPGFTLLIQILLAIFFGFIGLCLAVPLSLIGQIWLREVVIRDILDPWRSQIPASLSVDPGLEDVPNVGLVSDKDEAAIEEELK